jgi:hypothetical protein
MTRHAVDNPAKSSIERVEVPHANRHEEVRAAMEDSRPFGQISVDDFTEATFKSVMRALDAQQKSHGPTTQFIPGPIVYGIIFWPDGQPPILGTEPTE